MREAKRPAPDGLRARKSEHAYTLVELLAGVAIAAVLVTSAIPAFGVIARDSARTGMVNSFVQAIHLARSEAIKRNGVVSLCPSTDGRRCQPGSVWNTGWLVFVNDDRDSPAVRDAGESLLRAYRAWDTGHIFSNRPTLSFRAFGQMGVTATLTFCDDRGAAAARAVVVSQTGRPRVAERGPSGRPLDCSMP